MKILKKQIKILISQKTQPIITTFFIDNNLQIIYKTKFRLRRYNLQPD